MSTCRWDRATKTHLTPEHHAACASPTCLGCRPCRTDDDGNPVRHCRARTKCTAHLGWGESACPGCVGKIRANLGRVVDLLALMPAEAVERGINSEPANLAGPHADYVSAQWRLINADRAGQTVEELDLRDPYTCLTMHERAIREDLGHDGTTLVSATVSASADYLAWVLTDLARDEGQVAALASLLADTALLVSHMEAALRDGRGPERGAPCPECVGSKQGAPRLVRDYGHYCEAGDCEQRNHLDDTGDVWRCPQDARHEWTHDAYSRWVQERTKRTRPAPGAMGGRE